MVEEARLRVLVFGALLFAHDGVRDCLASPLTSCNTFTRYKRQLGHRIWPRDDFRALLERHRGPFERTAEVAASGERPGFKALADGESIGADELLNE